MPDRLARERRIALERQLVVEGVSIQAMHRRNRTGGRLEMNRAALCLRAPRLLAVRPAETQQRDRQRGPIDWTHRNLESANSPIHRTRVPRSPISRAIARRIRAPVDIRDGWFSNCQLT